MYCDIIPCDIIPCDIIPCDIMLVKFLLYTLLPTGSQCMYYKSKYI